MANAIYPKTKEAWLNAAGPDMNTDDIRAILVDLADYTYNAAHDFLDDVPAAARVAVSNSLDNPTITNGVFDADNETWGAVAGDPCEAVILYKHTGVEGTSQLIAYFDTFASGMPVTPNGGDITVQWSDGASKIFAL
jgi:hypothetical protein